MFALEQQDCITKCKKNHTGSPYAYDSCPYAYGFSCNSQRATKHNLGLVRQPAHTRTILHHTCIIHVSMSLYAYQQSHLCVKNVIFYIHTRMAYLICVSPAWPAYPHAYTTYHAQGSPPFHFTYAYGPFSYAYDQNSDFPA